MGNQLFADCQNNFLSSHSQSDLKPNIQLSHNTQPHLLYLHNQSNNNNNLNLQKQFKKTYKPKLQYFTHIPNRSNKINQIYQNLIKNSKYFYIFRQLEPIKYSIQNKNFLQNQFGVNNFKQLDRIITVNKQFNNNNNIGRNNISNNNNNQHNSLPKPQHSASLTVSQSQDHNTFHPHPHPSLNFNIIKYSFKSFLHPDSTIKQNSLQYSKKFIYSRQSFQNRKSYQIMLDSIYTQKQQNNNEYLQLIDQKLIDIFNDQYIYVGMLENNLPHGPGQLYKVKQQEEGNGKFEKKQKKNQNKYQIVKFIQAQFVNGMIETEDCVIILQEGHYFRGGFYNNNINGKGIVSISNGLQLQGTFKQCMLQGKGKAIYPDGGIFTGFFKNGKRQGKGKIQWKSEIKNETSQKIIKQIFFQGYFKNDKMNGLGYLKTPNYQYWGPFVNDMKQGKGTIKFKDGKKFQGWFQKDQINGYGQLHYSDGKIQKGIFPIQQKNKLQNQLIY